jgi:hypothetical protein
MNANCPLVEYHGRIHGVWIRVVGFDVLPIDLVLIDQQSMGKRSLHLMDTTNAKRDGRPFTGVSTILDREPYSGPLC